ncbi:MAG: hypothetical protein KDC10_09125 [Calditrichaeota bacterium]|nr:hypothetical protein [Candidatus Cloacimonadota bacterium]MCB1047351.1 hypothetical protein [Calditrichota bacterium]
MSRKLVEDLELGMTLNKDLHDQRGRFLLPSGTVLQEQHLRLLRQWRIPVVYVDSPEEEAEDWHKVSLKDLDPATHILNEKELGELFSLCDRTDGMTSKLFYYLLDRRNRLSVLNGGEA